MNNQLVSYGDKQITPLGNLYVEKVSDTLHRVKKHHINFIGGTSREITYQQYEAISKVLLSPNAPRFIRFKDDGDVIATNQIASIKTEETIIDTRREDF